ncbi:MAG: transposase [Dehalococcoidia bacterium]
MPEHDYSEPGAYFITIVVQGRACLFADLRFERCAEEAWTWLATRYANVELDEFVIMPNHLHGVISLTDAGAGGSRAAPTEGKGRKPIGGLIGAFKTRATKSMNVLRGTPSSIVWQRNYYERLIRTEKELQDVRGYILSNPAQWPDDPENPNRCDRAPVGTR